MKKKLIIFLIVLASIVTPSTIYLETYYEAKSYILESSDIVKVEKIKEGYFFDGPGEKALIFYPGGKVDEKAYSKLLYELAENGIDCFLVCMPYKLAVFDINKAQSIINKYNYDEWNLAGHSLGGAMISEFNYNHPDKINNLFLLGSYSTKDLSSKNKMIYYIYGSEDKIVNKDKLKDSMQLNKNYEEIIIEGGNHAQFGSYGHQKGDGKAKISEDEQIDMIVKIIKESIEDKDIKDNS